MRFEEIMPGLREGKVYKRNGYHSPVRLNDGTFETGWTNNAWVKFDINNDHVLSEIWEEYDPREYFDFPEAIRRMRAGKKVSRKLFDDDKGRHIYLDVSTQRIIDTAWDGDDTWDDEVILSEDWYEYDG